jgi:radical SAM superfamily enzyme YgiQ (UPF0313 family)
MAPRRLRTVLVAPSRYDEKGVLVFRVGINQNGSLGAISGLIEDYNRRHSGAVRIVYEVFDEHVREAVTPALLARWRDTAAAAGERFVLLVCGVQTATYPRARDIALMARSLAIDVVAGGVHLSSHGPSVDFLTSCGVSVGIGEVEPAFDRIVADALDGTLAPLYRIDESQGLRVKTAVSDVTAPDLESLCFPHMPRRHLARYLNPSHLYVDGSRGCPYLCSFCSVKNTFGRTVRSRSPERLAQWMAERVDRDGIRWFTFTDDNFIRNQRHLEILEGVAKIRSQGRRFSIGLILDVESSCYAEEDSPRGERTRRFLALCREAGVSNVFMGLESTNDASLQQMAKQVNRDRKAEAGDAHRAILDRYRTAVRAWQSIGASVECGYILGFDADGAGEGARAARDMIAIGIDIVSFYLLTPLPGAEDYARALQRGTLLERDFNEYFRNRTMVAHPRLSPAELEAELRQAVQSFYSFRNVALRTVRGLLGLGRPRVSSPWLFVKRQGGYKVMILAGMYTYFEGGLGRRRATVRREAVTDAEARARWLGAHAASGASRVPATMLDEGRMDSLPILRRHALDAKASSRA